MTDETELLPCPFCGSVKVYRDRYSVRCDNCGTEGPSRMEGEEQMDRAWNKRSTLPPSGKL